MSTCMAFLFLQVLLECWWLNPQPWEEQNPPTIQRLFTAEWTSHMVCWLLVAPAPELDDLGLGEEEIFISVRSFFIVWYCVEA